MKPFALLAFLLLILAPVRAATLAIDPALYTPAVEVFQWSAQNVSNGATPSRFFGVLCVPGIYYWGYNDEICAPTSTFTAYNVITAPKHLFLQVERGHNTPDDRQARIDARVLAQTAKK